MRHDLCCHLICASNKVSLVPVEGNVSDCSGNVQPNVSPCSRSELTMYAQITGAFSLNSVTVMYVLFNITEGTF